VSSPYGRAYRLAQRLAASSATPYAFVQRVLGLLRHGYVYDENPPVSRLPLMTFLFSARRGHCQHFSGAMALLLRMGGVPARVAAGFTPGTRDPGTGEWVVSDLNAHDWVEVWFPHFGWVRFDPTPASAPARAGQSRTPPVLPAGAIRPHRPAALHHHEQPQGVAPASRGAHAGSGSATVLPWVAVALLAALALLGLRPLLRAAGPDALIVELEQALRRCGRPAAPSLTLAALERRLSHRPPAAEYVARLRRRRYAGVGPGPSPAQRRALRAALREGLGASGRLRALWALPPRRLPRPQNPGGGR
jgi:hypothetical protein